MPQDPLTRSRLRSRRSRVCSGIQTERRPQLSRCVQLNGAVGEWGAPWAVRAVLGVMWSRLGRMRPAISPSPGSDPPPPCLDAGETGSKYQPLTCRRHPNNATYTRSPIRIGRLCFLYVSTSEASISYGGRPARRARSSARNSFRLLHPCSRHSSCTSMFGVAVRLALVRIRNLDLDHEIGRSELEVGVGRISTFGLGVEVTPGTLADVERAVRLQPRAWWIARPAQARAAEPSRRAGQRAPRGFDEVVENPGQILMTVRGRLQCDESTHRIQADPAEARVPVDRGKRGNGLGVGSQDVQEFSRGVRRASWRAESWRVLVSMHAGSSVYAALPPASLAARIGAPVTHFPYDLARRAAAHPRTRTLALELESRPAPDLRRIGWFSPHTASSNPPHQRSPAPRPAPLAGCV